MTLNNSMSHEITISLNILWKNYSSWHKFNALLVSLWKLW